MLYYRPSEDAVSAVHVDSKFSNELVALRADVETLLIEIQHGLRLSSEQSIDTPPLDTLTIEAPPPPPSNSLQTVNHHVIPQIPPRTNTSRPVDTNTRPVDTNNRRLLEQVRSACKSAGAVLNNSSSTNGARAAEGEIISGRYANTNFRVSIKGISGDTFDPENFYAVWKDPPNAARNILPGIRFLVNVVDATISSIKYVEILQQVARNNS
jgi:hypothetical protein